MTRKRTGNQNRVSEAIRAEQDIARACYRLILDVNNDGQHWIAHSMDNSLRVEWWPSTARAVRGTSDDRFKHNIRVATSEQFIDLIQQELEGVRVPPMPDAELHKPNVTYIAKSWPGALEREVPPQPTVNAMPTNRNTPSTWKDDAPVDAEPPRYVKVEVAQYCRLLVVEWRYKLLCRFAFGLVVLLLCVAGYLFDVLWSLPS